MDEPVPVLRVNHLVLQVRNVDRSVRFYTRLFGLREEMGRYQNSMAFLRAPGTGNWHDLAFLEVGEDAPEPSEGSVGLFHFALEVRSIADLIAARTRLIELGALVREHDHGATKSIYGRDPDGHNFEVMFAVPEEHWGRWATATPERLPLDLDAELARWG